MEERWHVPYIPGDVIEVDGVTVNQFTPANQNLGRGIRWHDAGLSWTLFDQRSSFHVTTLVRVEGDMVTFHSNYTMPRDPMLTPEIERYVQHWIDKIRSAVEERKRELAESRAADRRAAERAKAERLAAYSRIAAAST